MLIHPSISRCLLDLFLSISFFLLRFTRSLGFEKGGLVRHGLWFASTHRSIHCLHFHGKAGPGTAGNTSTSSRQNMCDDIDDEQYIYQSDSDQAEEAYVYSDYEEEAELKEDASTTAFSVPDGSFRVISYKETEPLMSGLLAEISDLLALNREAAQVLLRQFKWNRERLLEVYYNNPEKVMRDAGLASSSENPQSADAAIVCRICADEVGPNDAVGLDCNHNFCKDCYAEYLRIQVSDGPRCVMATCPEHKCHQTVPNSVFRDLLEPQEYAKYHMYSIRNFIETNRNMRWCPAPGCDQVVLAAGITQVRCNCGMPFCFRCGEEAHAPATCEQLIAWLEKCQNESETANWILANTKRCPACKTRIEKNQGCNHMTCGVCKHEFCWICNGPWSEHGANTGGYYKCNKYDANKPAAEESAAQKAKAELERYLHYYKGYAAHAESLKYANEQRNHAEQRMVDMQEKERSAWIDVQFLKSAVELLIDCRRVLKYTYVLGYFLEDGSTEKDLFEHHQSNLQAFTEHLSSLTEKDFEDMNRTEIVNYTRVTEKFMQGLLQSVSDGFMSDAQADVTISLAIAAGAEEKTSG